MAGKRHIEIGIKEGYALWSKFYDNEKNPLIAVEEPHVNKLLKTLPYSHVLDAGAGTGRYALKLARNGAHVTAIDICPEMLAIAKNVTQKEGLKTDFLFASLQKSLPFSAKRFDLVMCTLTLTHIPNMHNVMEEFYRVLKKEGHLLITDFHPDGFAQGWRTVFSEGEITYRLPNMKYTRQDYLESIENAGFNLLDVVDAPIREVPAGYLPEDILNNYSSINLCIIALAQK